MKNAVLGLIVERSDYGYDLVRRFDARFGSLWRVNASTIYVSLDKLYKDGMIVARDESGAVQDLSRTGPRRSPKVIYEATAAGADDFSTWLTAPIGRVEPMRSEVFLKLGLAKQSDAVALLQVIDVHIDMCASVLAEQLARYELAAGEVTREAVPWEIAASWYNADAGIGRLQADLGWLRRVRSGVEALRVHGAVPVSMLAPSSGMPPGWR